MKTIRKWSVILLSLVMVLSLVVPALAVSAKDNTVLNVCYAPDGNGINDIGVTAYKLADVAIEDGSYHYTLTPAFEATGIDINAILNGARANTDEAANKQLRADFGSYINENAEAIKEAAGNDVQTVQTATRSIGTKNTSTVGIAQFTGLTDGLYLVTTNASVWYGTTQYIPVPFLVNLPYVDGGVVNYYLTATMKFVTETETPEEPGNPDNPGNPGNPGGGGPYTYPDDPGTPGTPGTPAEPANPDVPQEEVEIPPADVPLAEPEIELLPEDVPMAAMPGGDEADDPDIEILEEDVPLAALPQTGLLWWPVPVMAAAGIALVIFGIISRKKTARDE